MNETKQKGLVTELQCQLAFSKINILLSAPICEDSRYDFIADVDGQLIRIQCKTCTHCQDKDYIKISARSVQCNMQQSTYKKYTNEEIDYFYTCYNNISYLIPVEECSSEKKLWLSNVRQNNSALAADYELKKIIKKIFNKEVKEIKNKEILSKAKKKKKNKCVDCGKEISSSATRCQNCETENRKQKPPISRDELKKLIRQKPFTKIGDDYGVSDNTIRKWCVKMKLPKLKKEINEYSDEEWEEI